MTEPVRLTYPGATVDTLLETVNGSNLSATHKITRSATLVIAASDSSAAEKAQADYVCAGADDQNTIHAAIAAINAPCMICLLSGTYDISSSISLPSYTVLFGQGPSTRIFAHEHLAMAAIVNADIDGGNTEILVKNLLIDGNSPNQPSCTGGVMYKNTTRSGVEGCWFYNQASQAVDFWYGCTECYATNNISWGDSVTYGEPAFDIRVSSKCIVSNNIVAGGRTHGVNIQEGSSKNIVVGNLLMDSVFGSGVAIKDTDYPSTNNIITGNIILNPYKFGVECVYVNCDHNVISDNIIVASQAESGIIMKSNNCTISGNIVYNSAKHGVWIQGENHIITGNDIHNNGTDGIYLTLGTNCNVSNNILTGNSETGLHLLTVADSVIIGNVSNGNNNGILIENGTNVTIGNNVCDSNTLYGCYLKNSLNLNVDNNIFSKSGSDGVLALTAAHAVSFTGNNVTQNTGYGIYFNACGTNSVISNNQISDNTKHGVLVSGGAHCSITGNVCYDNDSGSTGTYDQIQLNSTEYCIVADNVCYTLNHIGRYGIHISSSNEVVSLGNVCTANGSAGIIINNSDKCSIGGNLSNNNVKHGIWELNSDDVVISNNVCVDNGDTFSGIYIDASTRSIISNNKCSASDALHQDYGIKENGASDYNSINGNSLQNNAVANISKIGANSSVINNIGYTTENTGTATITEAATTVDVIHGLAAAPTRVLLSPTTATGGKDFYVSAKDATTFTITIDSPAEADISFDWQAMI